jgi:hypothetical protein
MDEKIRNTIVHGPMGRALFSLSMPIILDNLL